MKTKMTALALAALTLAASAAQAEPLKIGIIESLSGSQTSTGRMYATAIRHVLDELNAAGGFNGEPIQFIELDSNGNTSGAAARVRDAIAQGVHIVIQGSSSAIGGQITEDVRKHNIRNKGREMLYINVGAEAMELRGDKCHFHAFHMTTTAPMRVGPLAQVMAEEGKLGKRVYAFNQNYSWGTDMDATIKANAKAHGYEVVDAVLHEVNRIQDFAPFVAKIHSAKPDSVITGNWGNDLLLLMKATGDSGLKVTFGTTYLDQPGNLGNAGSTALGHYISHPGNVELMDPEEAEAYKARNGRYPSYGEPGTIAAVRLLGEALKLVEIKDGKVSANQIGLALEKARYQGPLGEIGIRAEDHQLVMPVVVSRVDKDVKYFVDGTDMGFKPVKVVSAEEAIYPAQASCKMKRPI